MGRFCVSVVLTYFCHLCLLSGYMTPRCHINNLYQQVLLPLMSSPEFSPDTLHIVCEPDFCFYEADSAARKAWAETALSESLVMDRMAAMVDPAFQAPPEIKRVMRELYDEQVSLFAAEDEQQLACQ